MQLECAVGRANAFVRLQGFKMRKLRAVKDEKVRRGESRGREDQSVANVLLIC